MNAIIQALAEVQTTVDAITAQVDKARAEIIGRISDLEAAIASADPAGIQAAVDALKSSVGTLTIASQAIDDIVTDAVTPPSEPPPVPTP